MSDKNKETKDDKAFHIGGVSNCTCDNDKRYCKGCYADVTKDMMCYCGEFPLTKDATLSQEELDSMAV